MAQWCRKAPPLTVELDGIEVAGVRFVWSDNLEAAEIISRLQRAGLSVFLASERMCAKQHGIDRYSGNMSAGDKIAFLHDLRRESINAAYIGDCLTNTSVAREAYLSIGFATRHAATDAEWEQGAPDNYFADTVDRFAAGTLRAGAGQRQTTPARAERSHDPQSALRSRRICIRAGADGSRIHFELWHEHSLQLREAASSRGSNTFRHEGQMKKTYTAPVSELAQDPFVVE